MQWVHTTAQGAGTVPGIILRALRRDFYDLVHWLSLGSLGLYLMMGP
jgi:hypothetical protein